MLRRRHVGRRRGRRGARSTSRVRTAVEGQAVQAISDSNPSRREPRTYREARLDEASSEVSALELKAEDSASDDDAVEDSTSLDDVLLVDGGADEVVGCSVVEGVEVVDGVQVDDEDVEVHSCLVDVLVDRIEEEDEDELCCCWPLPAVQVM